MWGTYYYYTTIARYIGYEMRGLLTPVVLVAITFLAQWHPLIAPERADLRPEYNQGPVASKGMF
jgi:hypothetical protein